MTDRRFATPELAALAAWDHIPSANARVVAVTIRGNQAQVVVDVGPGYRDWVYCCCDEGGWSEYASGNAPTCG